MTSLPRCLQQLSGAYHATRRQTAEGLNYIFEPRSIAVIGASPRRASVGHLLLSNILRGGFKGSVFACHPSAKTIEGVQTESSVKCLPGPVDLAVVCIPAEGVCAAARECASAGVKGLVVVSAGFSEAGEEGRQRSAELQRILRDSGMRMIGPNCVGFLNASPAVRLNACFATSITLNIVDRGAALLAQSGALGIAVMNQARGHF